MDNPEDFYEFVINGVFYQFESDGIYQISLSAIDESGNGDPNIL